MPNVVFIQANGREQSAQAVVGASVVQTAMGVGASGRRGAEAPGRQGAGMPSIVAERGGSALCATQMPDQSVRSA